MESGRLETVIINDASALIDLKKGQLLHVLGRLPYRLVVPVPIRLDEVMSFSGQDWKVLEDGGLEEYDLSGDEVSEARRILQERSGLSAHDCFCIVTAKAHESAVVLTGDRQLRLHCGSHGLVAHGILWIIDELAEHNCCDHSLLRSALLIWQQDEAVRLPKIELQKRVRKYSD